MEKAPVKEKVLSANEIKYAGLCLQTFEKNKEWFDYSHWLQKVAKFLEEAPSYQIPDNIMFAKRLAQCLHPNLTQVVHSDAIKVFSLIFKNFETANYDWSQDLALYSIGLFPLYQYASFQVKPKLLDLYRYHYFPLGKQLIPCLPGLVIAILPSVDEQNEVLRNNGFETMDQLGGCVGKRYFVGAIWLAILRNPKVRQSAIKYLAKRLERTFVDPDEADEETHSVSDDEEHDGEEKKENGPVPVSPSKTNGESPSKKKEEITEITKATAEQEANTEASTQQQPTEAVLEDQSNDLDISPEEIAFLKNLDSYEEDEDPISIEYPNRSSLVLNALISSLEDEVVLTQKTCLDFLYSHFKLASSTIFSDEEKVVLIQTALHLLFKKDQQIQRRIHTWLFGPPDMENKYPLTQKNEFVIELVSKAFTHIFEEEPKTSVQATLPLKVLQSFYMEHDHLIEPTLPTLSIPILAYISKYSQPESPYSEDVNKAGARFLENIASNFSILLIGLSKSLDQQIAERNDSECERIINLIEFTFKLEATMTSEVDDNSQYPDQIDYLKTIISSLLRSVSSVASDRIDSFAFVNQALSITLMLTEKLDNIEKKLNKICEEKNIPREEIQKVLDAAKKSDYNFTSTLIKFNKFYQKLAELSLSFGDETDIPKKLLSLLSTSSEAIVRCQIFQTGSKYDYLPAWIQAIISCIKCDFPSISIIGIRTIQILLSQDSKEPIFANYKSLITEDILKLTMEKLWASLDVHYIQNEVSDLIVSFLEKFPEIFSETISESFKPISMNEKEAAIRRFSSFWKMSNDMPKSEFINSGVGLFLMLEFLDDLNPLLRHASKSWLLDSVPYLFRILDPIFEALMQVNLKKDVFGNPDHLRLYVTDTEQYFFTEVYDTKKMQACIHKVRGILITANELFIRYIIHVKLSERIKQHKLFYEHYEMGDPSECTYLDLLVVLILTYIRGQALESLSPKFQIDNASVNASACEFMELLLAHVDNREVSAKISHFIIQPLLIVLNHAITNRDYVLQVQNLSLLKVIFFQSSYASFEGIKQKCVEILSSIWFVPNLLKGLYVDQPYVRVQFINFISLCIGPLTQNLQKDSLNSIVSSILKAYFEIILNKHLDKGEENDEYDSFESDNLNFDPKMLKRQDSKKDVSKFAKKTTNNMRYQDQNEIFILLDGVKKILNFFLKFNEAPEKEAQGNVVLGVVSEFLTFQFLFKPEITDKEAFALQYTETIKSILSDLFKIIYIFIYSWRLSREFREWVDFTSMGANCYSFEKYSEINKQIKEYHMKIDQNNKSVRALIISVIKPLMYQYTTETLNSFLNYWILECQKKKGLTASPRMMKEIEILVSVNYPIDLLIYNLSKNQIIVDISSYYARKTEKNKKSAYALNYDITMLKRDYLIRLWTTFMDFMKKFAVSKCPSTHLWLLELYYVMAQKYNPKEIVNEHRIKKEMHDQINDLLIKVSQICAQLDHFYFNEPGTEGTDSANFRTVVPFTPTVYEIYKNTHMPNQKSEKKATSKSNPDEKEVKVVISNPELDKEIFDKFETDTIEYSLYDRYRAFCFKTLKRIGVLLLQSTYAPEKIDRVIARTQNFMDIIFPTMENKNEENQKFLELASELIYSQLDINQTLLIKNFKKPVLDIFNGNDFFKCSKQTLKYWCKIIDWIVTTDRNDLFSEFVNNVSGFSYYFNKDSETKTKIKALERVCFIIYAGEIDKYKEKLVLLLEKIGEIIKTPDTQHPSLITLILFCMRILILRLSPSTLNDLFRQMWPILLTLLLQVFNNKTFTKNPNLMLAALKLIEMMDIVHLEEFYINQWAFLFDYYGIILETGQNPYSNIFASDDKRTKISGFGFQPYVTNSLNENLKIDYKPKSFGTQKTAKKIERKIILTMNNCEDESEIKGKALELCQYMVKNNEFRSEVDHQQLEFLLEGDFISLDDYIFKSNP